MTSITDLAKARQRLLAAQKAAAAFLAQHKGKMSENDAAEYERLLVSEMSARIRLTDLELAPKRGKQK